MPEYQVSPEPPKRTTLQRIGSVLDWLADDSADANWVVPPSVLEGVAGEIRSVGQGEITPESGGEKFGIKTTVKQVAGGPVGKASIDLLFGGQSAGGADRDPRPQYVKMTGAGEYTVVAINPGGKEEFVKTVKVANGGFGSESTASSGLVVAMPEMWNADP